MGATNSILTLLLLVIFVSSIAVNDAQCGGGTVNCDGGQTCCQGGFFCCRGGSFCCPRGRTCSNPPGRCFQIDGSSVFSSFYRLTSVFVVLVMRGEKRVLDLSPSKFTHFGGKDSGGGGKGLSMGWFGLQGKREEEIP
ncbi:hypothetical protein Tco_1411010 [Tanacetum coccineum]